MRALVAMCIALSCSGCTLLFPLVGVSRAGAESDVDLDDRGCERPPDGSATATCVHPEPVDYDTTIIANAGVGLLCDILLVGIFASSYHAN